MTISNFTMFVAACALAIHPTTVSAVVMQESLEHIYARSTNDNPKVLRQSFMFEKTIAIAKRFRQFGCNFDINLRQINVRNLEYFDMSFSDFLNPCANLKAIQAVMTHCYECEKSEYSSKKTMLQSVLSLYNTESFKNASGAAYVRKIASHIGAQVSTPLSKKPQESVELDTEQPEQTMKIGILPPFSENLEDVFTHKTSSVRDAFTTEDSSSTTEDSSSFVR
ncbi:trwN protein [Bartonella koehlerae]|uniref:Transglycosylase SLT domain-containing protein n=1 Tax=Bartonella koehlerae C-29 TaxID=1134510 RepID=A0A067WAK3_9HYPH|nr:trwN protein [Bartonella koehlerae]KEC55941.1 hypothetical protein O9A_00166 [Bartonella koehlerae C-29]